MIDQIVFSLSRDQLKERSQLAIGVTFRDRAAATTETPTNIRYRLDCLATGRPILDWTSVSTDDEVTITVTAPQNAIQLDSNLRERKQLTVAANYELSSQYVETVEWEVVNLCGSY